MSETPRFGGSRLLNLPMLSLVSGIFAFMTMLRPGFQVLGILAIIVGHFARLRIRNGKANPKGNSLAFAGLCLGYSSVIFGTLNMHDQEQMLTRARKLTSLATATAVESAVNNFFSEYGSLPSEKDRVVTDTGDGLRLITTLLGTGSGPSMQKPRFLAVKEGKNRKGGLIYDSSGKPEALYDPWGSPYTVELEASYTDRVHFMIGSETIELNDRRVAVYSPGPDKKLGTGDDIRTW